MSIQVTARVDDELNERIEEGSDEIDGATADAIAVGSTIKCPIFGRHYEATDATLTAIWTHAVSTLYCTRATSAESARSTSTKRYATPRTTLQVIRRTLRMSTVSRSSRRPSKASSEPSSRWLANGSLRTATTLIKHR